MALTKDRMNQAINDEARWSSMMIDAQQGNEDIYRQLLHELGNAISAYLRVRFGNIDIMEDCVQESLIAIHQARHSYEQGRLFRPWLFAIVRHKAIDALRKKQTQQKVLDAQENSVDSEISTHHHADEMVNCGKLLSALPDKHRQAIILTKLEGLTMREAAQHLNISESAMKVRVHRALHASRQLLEAEFN